MWDEAKTNLEFRLYWSFTLRPRVASLPAPSPPPHSQGQTAPQMAALVGSTLAGYLCVGAAWGVTNPFLRRESAAMEDDVQRGRVDQVVHDLVYMFTHWRFALAFLLNQSGSLFYYYMLGSTPVSRAVPICNSLAFVFTAVTAILLGEQVEDPRYVAAGTACVIVGVAICLDAG